MIGMWAAFRRREWHALARIETAVARGWVHVRLWSHRRTALVILGWALLLRLAFAALTANTYDPDEFVILTLSRGMAHGAVPYRSFLFFHPPGVLVLFGQLQSLVNLWWPSGRIMLMLIDSITAVMVWRIGRILYSDRVAFAAGMLYGASPIPLLAAVHIGQDSLITALGVAGLLCLLLRRSLPGAILAGALLGLAIWIKYPALVFLPVYVMAAPRRSPAVLLGAAATLVGLLVPLAHEFRNLYAESVTWQMVQRVHAAPPLRLAAVISFWLVLNPLAAYAILRRRRAPLWLLVGFAMGGVFIFAAEAYYHYFAPIAPFAALLAAPLLVTAFRRRPRTTLLVGAAVLGLWAAAANIGPAQAGLGLLPLSGVQPAIRVLDNQTARGQRVLADEFEYAYLAHRPPASDYFWNLSTVTSARSLEHVLPGAAAVVTTTGNALPYPPGFMDYLKRHRYSEVRAGEATIWILPRRKG
ncbi:MAG TPA: glycosyltransferase family 39 protein [Chloroflexota bacterium]|nr:glycosyltransferase family 39 protein [Chloroflexota bacterium]